MFNDIFIMQDIQINKKLSSKYTSINSKHKYIEEETEEGESHAELEVNKYIFTK